MSDMKIPIIQNTSKIVSDFFPRPNKQHLIESSIEKNYLDKFYPINCSQQLQQL